MRITLTLNAASAGAQLVVNGNTTVNLGQTTPVSGDSVTFETAGGNDIRITYRPLSNFGANFCAGGSAVEKNVAMRFSPHGTYASHRAPRAVRESERRSRQDRDRRKSSGRAHDPGRGNAARQVRQLPWARLLADRQSDFERRRKNLRTARSQSNRHLGFHDHGRSLGREARSGDQRWRSGRERRPLDSALP